MTDDRSGPAHVPYNYDLDEMVSCWWPSLRNRPRPSVIDLGCDWSQAHLVKGMIPREDCQPIVNMLTSHMNENGGGEEEFQVCGPPIGFGNDYGPAWKLVRCIHHTVARAMGLTPYKCVLHRYAANGRVLEWVQEWSSASDDPEVKGLELSLGPNEIPWAWV